MFNLDDLIHLSGKEITSIHDSILENSAGLKGNKPNLSIEAIVGRIHMNLTYQRFNSIQEVAALYAEAIACGHVFNDGNKRSALTSMLTFLYVNGYSVKAQQIEIADKIVDIAEGRINYTVFAAWLTPRLVALG